MAALALSRAFGQDPFGPPFGAELADPLGTAAGRPPAVADMPSVVAIPTAPPSEPLGAPPLGASAPAAPTKGAAGPSPAAPSLPLLPPTGTHAGPAHRGAPLAKAHPYAMDSGAAGPNPVYDCNVLLTAPAFVPVNAFDYNGSPVTPPDGGIPAKRDFDVAPLPVDDPLLLAASVEVQCPVAGVLDVTVAKTGGGNIDLWRDQQKQVHFNTPITTIPTDETIPFYIEGKHESSALDDVTLTFTLTYPGGPNGEPTKTGAQQTITVTPLINDYTDRAAAGATGQNVWFYNDTDGSRGLKTDAAGAPQDASGDGMYFHASLNDTNLPGAGRFVQNVVNVTNGANGDTTYQGGSVGWLYAPGATDQNGMPIGAADYVIGNASHFPLLDIGANDTAPEYKFDWAILKITGGTYEFEAGDSPWTGNPVDSQLGTAVDLVYRFRTWLLWRYNNAVGVVYYPIAYADWTVRFWATASNAQTGPIDTINILHGVGGNPYVRSNSPPYTMSATVLVNGQPVSDVANNVFTWVTES